MVNSERERFFIPFFFNPGHRVWVQPLEEMTKGEKPKYTTWENSLLRESAIISRSLM